MSVKSWEELKKDAIFRVIPQITTLQCNGVGNMLALDILNAGGGKRDIYDCLTKFQDEIENIISNWDIRAADKLINICRTHRVDLIAKNIAIDSLKIQCDDNLKWFILY